MFYFFFEYSRKDTKIYYNIQISRTISPILLLERWQYLHFANMSAICNREGGFISSSEISHFGKIKRGRRNSLVFLILFVFVGEVVRLNVVNVTSYGFIDYR